MHRDFEEYIGFRMACKDMYRGYIESNTTARRFKVHLRFYACSWSDNTPGDVSAEVLRVRGKPIEAEVWSAHQRLAK